MKLLSFLFALSAIMSLLLERTVVAAEALRGSSDTDVPNNHAHQRGLVNCPPRAIWNATSNVCNCAYGDVWTGSACCPVNAYFDWRSLLCKCNPGYQASSTRDGSCTAVLSTKTKTTTTTTKTSIQNKAAAQPETTAMWAPAPAPMPGSQPQPQPVPASQPQPQPVPASQPQPQPVPASQPQPQPQPASRPALQPQPVSQPSPASQPASNSITSLTDLCAGNGGACECGMTGNGNIITMDRFYGDNNDEQVMGCGGAFQLTGASWNTQWGGTLSETGPQASIMNTAGLTFSQSASYDGWEGCCTICGLNLQLSGKLSSGWYCQKDFFSTGIWLRGKNT